MIDMYNVNSYVNEQYMKAYDALTAMHARSMIDMYNVNSYVNEQCMKAYDTLTAMHAQDQQKISV